MFKFFTGFGIGLFAGYLLGFVIPIKVFMITGLVLVALVTSMFYLFHLGLRDFQEY